MIIDFLLYAGFFLFIWMGAGLIVSSVDDLSEKLRISAFAASFFVLGILTSLPEVSVGISSLIDRNPSIFVGNLIGASFVLLIFVIPLLAILGNGISFSHQLSREQLLFSLLVVIAPSALLLDGMLTLFDASVLFILYVILFYIIEKKRGLLERTKDLVHTRRTHIFVDTSKLVAGAIVVFLSSKFIVDFTIQFGSVLSVSPYLISLLLLSVGTNLPEISLALRSVAARKKEVALGDYIGSAAANTLIFSILLFIHREPVVIVNHPLSTFIFFVIGTGLFYLFARSKNTLSRKEGLILFGVYILFLVIEYKI